MLARLVLNSRTSSNPPALASQSAGIAGMIHHAWPYFSVFLLHPGSFLPKFDAQLRSQDFPSVLFYIIFWIPHFPLCWVSYFCQNIGSRSLNSAWEKKFVSSVFEMSLFHPHLFLGCPCICKIEELKRWLQLGEYGCNSSKCRLLCKVSRSIWVLFLFFHW